MTELVFDIGMHNGDDTAYYLARGYEVVAVDANPVLCESAAGRFRAEIDQGRLTIRNVGIAETAGELDFWVSEQTEWSSFHQENATKDNTGARRIRVPTVRFSDLMSEYRLPLYVKVDIEMNDSLCINEIGGTGVLPRYFSFEGHVNAAADVNVLAGLGYARFKCIRQVDWRSITPENMRRQATMRRLIARSGVMPRAANMLRQLHYRAATVDSWRFNPGSSGPFGPDLPGRWLSRDETLVVWEHRLAVDREMDAGGLGEWFDIHAAVMQ